MTNSTHTVKSPAEQHFRNYVEKGLNSGKKIVVSGCVSQGQPNSAYLNGISIVGVQVNSLNDIIKLLKS